MSNGGLLRLSVRDVERYLRLSSTPGNGWSFCNGQYGVTVCVSKVILLGDGAPKEEHLDKDKNIVTFQAGKKYILEAPEGALVQKFSAIVSPSEGLLSRGIAQVKTLIHPGSPLPVVYYSAVSTSEVPRELYSISLMY